MQNQPEAVAELQSFVLFNIGGKVFKITQASLERHPDSLLSRMVEEFLGSPTNEERLYPLYVDRSPKLFEGILEIYRRGAFLSRFRTEFVARMGGDYASCIPATNREVFQKELDFYQLPPLEDLSSVPSVCAFLSKDRAKEELMQQLLYEIEASGLKDMFLWDIFIYYVIEEGKPTHQRKACVRVPRGMRSHSVYYTEGVHSDFFAAMEGKHGVPQAINQQIVYQSFDLHSKYVVPETVTDAVNLLQSSAAEQGMQVSTQPYSQPLGKDESVVLSCVRLAYAS